MSATRAKSQKAPAPTANGKRALGKARPSNLLKLEAAVDTPLGTIQERAAEGFFEAQLQLLYAVVLNAEPDLSLSEFFDRIDEVGLEEYLESVGVEL